MERQPPSSTNDAIDLYIRTYYSLLRSSGEVRVRSFEESHAFSDSSLHPGARDATPDVAAFAYAAARLPACMPAVGRVVLGQSHEQFEAAGHPVQDWDRVRARGRRRPQRWNGGDTLAVFVTSTSDIDDLVPILTAYQIEWNKLYERLAGTDLGRALAGGITGEMTVTAERDAVGGAVGLDAHGAATLAAGPLDLVVRLLNGSFSQYQRTAQRWWSGIEPRYVRPTQPRRPPVYFVSSNTHALANMLGGYALARRDEVLARAMAEDREGLGETIAKALATRDEGELANLSYYLLGQTLRGLGGEPVDAVRRYEEEAGIATIEDPGHVDVNAQVVSLAALRPERLDARVRVPGIEALAGSDAVVLNIDYPLGMAAYHHLARVAQGVGEVRGIYVMGKAATLNGRVGDVMVSGVIHDEHSQNTYLLRNCFGAADVQPYLRHGTVLDNQKALTVRSAFLQNREYMGVFYREGYTVLEMEAGPYVSAVFEMADPRRHPINEIVHLSNVTPFDLGILHYASDTPYSRRQSLLSKSLSFFGVDATYGCATAIVRRILQAEVARVRAGG